MRPLIVSMVLWVFLCPAMADVLQGEVSQEDNLRIARPSQSLSTATVPWTNVLSTQGNYAQNNVTPVQTKPKKKNKFFSKLASFAGDIADEVAAGVDAYEGVAPVRGQTDYSDMNRALFGRSTPPPSLRPVLGGCSEPIEAATAYQSSNVYTAQANSNLYQAAINSNNPPGLALQSQTQYQPSCIGIRFQPDGWGHDVVTYVCDRSNVHGKILPGDIEISANGMSAHDYERSEQLIQDCGSKVEIIYYSVRNNRMMHITTERHPLSWFPAWFSEFIRARR